MKKIGVLSLIVILLAVATYLNFNKILKLIFKTEYKEYVERYSQKYDVDPLLVYSIIKAESNFDKKAISNRGACGLMQLMETTAKEVATNETIEYESGSTLYDAEKNIELGVGYFAGLRKQFKNDAIALAAYNAGSGNVTEWIKEETIKEDGSDIENIPFKETNMYVRKILRDYKIYQKLYNE